MLLHAPPTSAPQNADDAPLDNYVALVRQIAASVARRLPRHVELAELVALGNLGLVEARRRWDPSRGVPFGAFASFRIRGAIIDALRDEDMATREERARIRQDEAGGLVLRRVGLEATAALCVEDEDPDALIGRSQDAARVRRALARLSERERIVIEAHFLTEEPLRSIGKRLGVTESRVCQIVRGAIARLQALVRAA